jgi:hypothetical protein
MAATQATTTATSDTAPDRALDGRFLAQGSFHGELDAVADVARHAAREGEDPTEIGRVRFDTARDALGLALPSAQALVKRIGRPLATIIEMALAADQQRAFAAGHDHANETQREFPKSLMLAALRAASREVDGRPPSRLAYDGMVARDNESRAARRLPTQRLPHSETIATRFGSWEHALLEAGLIESLGATRANPRKAPPAAETLDVFISEVGFLPGSGYFSEWCKASGIKLGRDLKPWDDVVENCRTIRAARGEDMPERDAPGTKRPPVSETARSAPSTRGRKVVTVADCEASVRAWSKSGVKGTPTFRKYKKWAEETEGAVSASSILRAAGSFTKLCRRLGVG